MAIASEKRCYHLADQYIRQYGFYSQTIKYLQSFLNSRRQFIVAIDGRCASGKTTLAAFLSRHFTCTIFHMDGFFLPDSLRTKERLEQPGGNVDYDRFRKEVLEPVSQGKPVSLCPFDCFTGQMLSPVEVAPANIVIVEGSYAMHPALSDYYYGGIFLTCSPKEQLRRLAVREDPAILQRFINEWIPLEERYFSCFSIESRCGLILDTTP